MASSSSSSDTTALPPPPPPLRVIVIGAGIAGLACARELRGRRYHVLVVEARERPGGRLKGMDFGFDGSQSVDLGGALIHGIDENPIYNIVDQMGITVRPMSSCLLLNNKGEEIESEQDDHISQLFNDCLEQTFEHISFATEQQQQQREEERGGNENDSENNNNNDDDKQQSSFGQVLEQLSAEALQELSEQEQDLFEWHKANLEVSCGASFGRLGYRWNDDEAYGFDGAHVGLQQSWSAVIDGLAEGLDIRYGAVVKHVSIVNPINHKKNKKRRTTATTSSATAAVAVPTTAASSRQSSTAATRTTVVASPQRASRRLQGESATVRRSSRSTKGVFLEKRFNITNIGSMSYDQDTTTTMTNGGGGTKKKKRRQSAASQAPRTQVQVQLKDGTVLTADAVVCTLPLGILKRPSNKDGGVTFTPPLTDKKQNAIQRLGCGLLNKCCLLFSHVFWQDSDFMGLVTHGRFHLMVNAAVWRKQPVCVFWFGGDFAQEIENWTDAAVVEDCLQVLAKATGTTPPRPLDYVVTRWGQERYSRCAFVYIPPGVDSHQELEAMSEPVLTEDDVRGRGVARERPALMFAGEHTTPYHPSTIHGAFMSGIREAYRLDLAVEPSLNNNMVFANDALYQRTFPVKRRFPKPPTPKQTPQKAKVENVDNKNKSKGSTASSAEHHHRHKKRGAAGVMTLRKCPKTILAPAPPLKKRNAADVKHALSPPPQLPSRRSHRATAGTTSSSEQQQQQQQSSGGRFNYQPTEDEALRRGVESYGNHEEGWRTIQSKLLPVFCPGDQPQLLRRKSVAQLRARYKELVSTNHHKQPKQQQWGAWLAPKESIQKPAAAFNGVHGMAAETTNHRRKSGRRVPRKVVLDM